MLGRKVMLGIMTPFGPVTLRFTVEEFVDLIQTLTNILDDAQKETPIPQIFIDAFKEEEDGKQDNQ